MTRWSFLLAALIACAEERYLPLGDLGDARAIVLAFKDPAGRIQGEAVARGEAVGPLALPGEPEEVEARLIRYSATLEELHLPHGALLGDPEGRPLPLEGYEQHLDWSGEELRWDQGGWVDQPWPEARFFLPDMPPRQTMVLGYVGAGPAAGLDVCRVGPAGERCRRTDARGAVELEGLVSGEEWLLVARGYGLAPHLFPLRVPAQAESIGFPIIDNAYFSRILERAPNTVSSTTGQIVFLVNGKAGGRSGARVHVDPPTGRVYYADGQGFLDPDRTSTGPLGIGGVLNAASGTVALSVERPSDCEAEMHIWRGPREGAVAVPVRSGHISWGSAFRCP